jgi:hypothetical protein
MRGIGGYCPVVTCPNPTSSLYPSPINKGAVFMARKNNPKKHAETFHKSITKQIKELRY